jgi:uncharacterized protein
MTAADVIAHRSRAAQRRPTSYALREAVRAAAPRPVLIIAGGAVRDGPAAGCWFQAASPTTVYVWVAVGTGHIAALATRSPGAWEARVRG